MTEKLGSTGLSGTDEGKMCLGISEYGGNVVIQFGTPVSWLGMPPQQAVGFAESLIRMARIVARRTGDVLTVSL